MRFLTQIRALFVLVTLASHSPLGFAVESAHSNTPFRVSYVGLFTFIGRFTRFEAALQFDPTKTAVSRCPSRYVSRSVAVLTLKAECSR